MAYEIGTADNHKDLLNRLRLFITDPTREITSGSGILELDPMPTGEWWATERWNTDFDGSGGYELIVNGPGSSGADEIFVGIQTYEDFGDDYYNWKMFGATGFVSGQTAQLQPGATQGCWPKMLMWNQPMDYWFIGNGRRFVVITKVSSVYEMMYLGFCLPYGLPTQFPYPLVIGGSFCYNNTPRYSDTSAYHRGFASPYGNSPGDVCSGSADVDTLHFATLKALSGTNWIKFNNRSSLTTFGNTNIVWPYVSSYYQYSGGDDPPYNMAANALRENLDGSYPVFPLVLIQSYPNNNIMGELQGCFFVPGFGGIAAEDTFTIGSDTYITFPIVPNANRTDFMCIKKD
jgi:hypothetical protein